MPLTHETMPAGPEALLTVRPVGSGLTTMAACTDVLWPTPSVTVKVAVAVRAATGVPVIAPSPVSVRPVGSWPPVSDQV
ncbi:hypothetical protein [Dactylosporangium sp. NPDC049140]|uniref:hypothetical protein n=1 Tax=Dactylosporangium sp. NPDC049140 TaxID=3155647 RepID=UPI0034088877